MPAAPTEYVTTAEAAQISGFNEEYVRRLVRTKKVDAVLKGGAYWIDANSLRSYIAQVEELGTQRFNWRRQRE